MKKVYQKPTSTMYDVELQSIIAVSNGSVSLPVYEKSASASVETEADERGSWGSLW
jgi:hypothetical protein